MVLSRSRPTNCRDLGPNCLQILSADGKFLLAMKELNAHRDILSGARGLNFGPSLQVHPCFVYANSEGSTEYAYLKRLN